MIAAVIVGAGLRGHAVAAGAAALVVTGLLGVAAHRRLGGYTGDVLGACVVLAESAALATLALSSG